MSNSLQVKWIFFLNINDLSEVQLCMSSNSWTWVSTYQRWCWSCSFNFVEWCIIYIFFSVLTTQTEFFTWGHALFTMNIGLAKKLPNTNSPADFGHYSSKPLMFFGGHTCGDTRYNKNKFCNHVWNQMNKSMEVCMHLAHNTNIQILLRKISRVKYLSWSILGKMLGKNAEQKPPLVHNV